MAADLAAWNDGKGVCLETWVGCMGNFKLAAGYAALFWPRFVLFEDYVLRDYFTVETLRGFEKGNNGNKQAVEWVINHEHLECVQHMGCEDISEDKLVFIGRILKEMWEAKLAWQFPDRPCRVEFYEPADRSQLSEYQISFWQTKHEAKS